MNLLNLFNPLQTAGMEEEFDAIKIGISTDKIHVRGPVGLHGLTSQKWIVLGNGQIRT